MMDENKSINDLIKKADENKKQENESYAAQQASNVEQQQQASSENTNQTSNTNPIGQKDASGSLQAQESEAEVSEKTPTNQSDLAQAKAEHHEQQDTEPKGSDQKPNEQRNTESKSPDQESKQPVSPPPEAKKIKISISREDLERMKLAREDVDFVGDSKAAMLAKSTPLSKVLLFLIIFVLIVGLVWAAFSNLDELVRGIGKVVPASHVQNIQNLEGGILSKILVKEGDSVKKGQILLKLDNTRFLSQYSEVYSQYISKLACVLRLDAEINNKKTITFPPEVLKNQKLIHRQNHLFASRKKAFKNTIDNLKNSYNLFQKEIKIVEPLVKKGVMSRVELLRLKRDAASFKTRLDSYKDAYYEKILTHLVEERADVERYIESLKALKDREQRTVIRSPVNGIVKQIYVNTLGGVVKPAVLIMEIVPLKDQLIIESRIRPEDIGFIKIGQKATIKITAYDYSVYGGLKAVVTNISADTSIDATGRSFYEVTLRTDKNYLGEKKGNFPIIPGMVASVDIMTGEKSVLTYILKPILRAKEKSLRER